MVHRQVPEVAAFLLATSVPSLAAARGAALKQQEVVREEIRLKTHHPQEVALLL